MWEREEFRITEKKLLKKNESIKILTDDNTNIFRIFVVDNKVLSGLEWSHSVINIVPLTRFPHHSTSIGEERFASQDGHVKPWMLSLFSEM